MSAAAFHRVPPDPQVMAQLHAEYLRYRGKKKLSFAKYLKKIGFTDPAAGLKGADRGSRPPPRPGMERVLVPARAVTGTLRLLVLLADFPDNKGLRPASEFEDMLFSNGTFQTGSMRDFYSEVSCGKVAAQRKAIWSHKADDRYDLENPNDSDAGDPGDPFRGSSARHELGDIGLVSTSFPGQQPSGVSLRSITLDASGNVRLDVIFA